MIALVRAMPVKAVADLLDVGADRIWRVVTHYVETARAEQDFSPDGACYSRRHPPTASATAMRLTAIPTQIAQKRPDRSVRRAEK